jgi:hypothetical protein
MLQKAFSRDGVSVSVFVFNKSTKLNSKFATLFLYKSYKTRNNLVTGAQMITKRSFEHRLKRRGLSEKTIEKLWKWYDFSEKKGVASY